MKPVRHDARTGAREGAISRAAKLYSETQNLSQSLTAAYESGYESGHLSQSRDAWTTVEKGWPTDRGIYLVTTADEPPYVTADFWSTGDGGAFLDNEREITAWMPLPAPYEQEK
jgi:predicted lipoprotein